MGADTAVLGLRLRALTFSPGMAWDRPGMLSLLEEGKCLVHFEIHHSAPVPQENCTVVGPMEETTGTGKDK